jgi:hypothetical protein
MFNPCNPKYPLFTFAIALFVGGIPNPSSAAEFKFPDQVDIYVKSLGGGAGANSEFGLGTTSENFVTVLSGLPNNPSTNSEVFLGSFNPDQPIPLAVLTNWNGQSFFATIGSTDMASQIVFSDLDNSLGFGGNTFELLDTNIFLAHLDDAASFTVVDILAAVKRTAIPKPHDLGFCFFPLRGSAPALTDLLCSGLMVALQTDTASPAAKMFLLALISRSW